MDPKTVDKLEGKIEEAIAEVIGDHVFIVIIDAWIEWLGLACRFQKLGQLPGLEDRLDLGNEGRDFRPKVGKPLGGFEIIQEYFAEEICECFVGPELVLDHPCGVTLLDPDLAGIHHRSSRCSSQ